MNAAQIKLIHVAARQVGLCGDNQPRYRLLLKNVGGVESSKNLSKEGFEGVMAVMEGMGFRHTEKPADFYRRRADAWRASPEQVHLLRRLAEESRYELVGLCRRHSAHRTDQVEELTRSEAWIVTEMLRASNEREGSKSPATELKTEELPF